MRVVTIPTEQTFLVELFKLVQEEGVILQTIEGQQFVLLSLAGWQGFDVGAEADFEQEVKATSEHKELMTFLATRLNKGKRISLTEVKKRLGLS
jgi:hypothetical protein